MNKEDFIINLSKQINYSLDKCSIINDILESNFFISKKNELKIITELKKQLNIEDIEADMIYNTAIDILKKEIKNSLKHPFKSK